MQLRVIQKLEIFLGSRISKFLRSAQRYNDFKHFKITCHGKTEHGIFVKFKNRAKLLLSSLRVSPSRVLLAPGTSSYHLVPKHLRATWAQAWTIPPPSWGLLSQWHRQQTTTPETIGASPARPQPSDILKRFYALYDIEWRYFMKKVSKLYYLFNPLLHMLPIGNMWFQLKLKNNSCNRGLSL